jgi:phenylacetate-CoA ligase
LVFTSLTKQAFPVIRYRTRDLTRLLPGTARSMRRMEKITGRSDDMLIIRGVNVFPTQIEELILGQDSLSPHYVLELRRENRLDALDVVVEVKPDRQESLADSKASYAEELTRAIKSYTGVAARVHVVPVGTVERSMGKAKRIIDLRGEE